MYLQIVLRDAVVFAAVPQLPKIQVQGFELLVRVISESIKLAGEVRVKIIDISLRFEQPGRIQSA